MTISTVGAIYTAALLFLLAACSSVTGQAPQPPNHTITITRAQYDAGAQVKSPSWKAHVSLQNSSGSEWVLGPALIIIETGSPESPIKEISQYVYRDRDNDDTGEDVLVERYGLFFGYRVQSDGTAIIPFGSLSELVPKDSGAFVNLFIAALASPRRPVLAGGAFGRVPARGKHEFQEEIIAPAAPKQRGPIVVVLPSIRTRQPANSAPFHVWYEYPAADVAEGAELTGGTAFTAPRTAAGLIAEVGNPSAPFWKRRLALNWLAEDFPSQSTQTILQVAADSAGANDELRRSAISNIGAARIKQGGVLLSSLVENDANLRPIAIRALGNLGDPTHAPAVRKFLATSDQRLKRLAIDALGSMKDAGSISALMELLKTKERNPDYQLSRSAATALRQISGEASYQDLLALVEDKKLQERMRLAIISSFQAPIPDSVVDSLSRLLLQQPRSNSLTREVAGAIGRAGTPKALSALMNVAASGREDMAEDAIREVSRRKDVVWRKSVIGLGSAADYKHRAKALYYIGLFEVKEGVPVLREATGSMDANVVKSACAALNSLKETSPPTCK